MYAAKKSQEGEEGKKEDDDGAVGDEPASGRRPGGRPSSPLADAAAEEARLEELADQLLREAGAFRRSTGILSGKWLREVAAREESLEEISEAAIVELGAVDLWDEMDALAAWCGLTPPQKAALSMWRLGEYRQQEIAEALGCSRRCVQRLLGRALRRIRRGAREFPGTPRALFWAEVRWKSRLIYHKPSHGWRSGAGGKEKSM